MDISPVISTTGLQPECTDTPRLYRSDEAPENKGTSRSAGISPESYPTKFRALAKAILQLGDNRTNVQVGFEAVRQLIGSKEDVKALKVGFVTFTGMVNQATLEKCVRQSEAGSETRWLALLPVCSCYSV